MPSLKTITLGCKVNQYETEYVRQGFQRLGYHNAVEGEPIDLCIVNTCTVTAESEAKCRKIIRRFAKAHPETEIIVLGCYAARSPDEAAALPGVVEVIGDKRLLSDLLTRRGLIDIPRGIERFHGRRRAYVKVQDGCRNRCSYCIIPSVRPNLSSRPIYEVLDEVRRLVAGGHHEIVLTGIHLGDYGWRGDNLPKHEDLAQLVRRIADLPGEFRIRLSSIEAAEVTPELVAVMAERPERICPHLHLPLQSGADAILKRMNRRWTSDRFLEQCETIRALLDRPALTTDVIVGFPGETEAHFEATCRVVEKIEFAKVHVFRFSPREGTPAATMADQVTNRIVQERAERLGNLGGLLQDGYCQSLLGRQCQVLVEGAMPNRPGWMLGTTERHVLAAVPGSRALIGQLVEATADRFEAGQLLASNG